MRRSALMVERILRNRDLRRLLGAFLAFNAADYGTRIANQVLRSQPCLQNHSRGGLVKAQRRASLSATSLPTSSGQAGVPLAVVPHSVPS
jgi:hypothetical protein